MRLLYIVTCVVVTSSFKLFQNRAMKSNVGMSTWQEDLDKLLDVDTECASRRGIASDLVQKIGDISDDLIAAVQDGDVKKVAPPGLKYGKAVVGLQALQRQILSDIIPDLVSRGIPRLIESGPKILNQVVKSVPEKSQVLFSAVREIAQDPSALQATVDDLRNEVKNIVRSTPEGLETPAYVVERTTDDFEVRKYSRYSVVSVKMSADEINNDDVILDPLTSGTSFASLASYVFGKNADDRKMSMTTPVVIESGSMAFVLPNGYTAETAPVPTFSELCLKDIDAEVIAVREFPGLATDGEVSRQRALLEDSLLANGIIYDNLSFKVLQYNPPYTLPWLRRNEVSLKIDYSTVPPVPETPESSFVSKDESNFFSAPEAGD